MKNLLCLFGGLVALVYPRFFLAYASEVTEALGIEDEEEKYLVARVLLTEEWEIQKKKGLWRVWGWVVLASVGFLVLPR